MDGGELDLDQDPHGPKKLDPEPMRIRNTALLFSACVNMWDGFEYAWSCFQKLNFEYAALCSPGQICWWWWRSLDGGELDLDQDPDPH